MYVNKKEISYGASEGKILRMLQEYSEVENTGFRSGMKESFFLPKFLPAKVILKPKTNLY